MEKATGVAAWLTSHAHPGKVGGAVCQTRLLACQETAAGVLLLTLTGSWWLGWAEQWAGCRAGQRTPTARVTAATESDLQCACHAVTRKEVTKV